MPSLSEHQSSRFVKMFLIGDSGTGKTGALTSLIAAGLKVRVLDLDNGLDSLRQFVMHDCPDKIGLVDFETRRDSYKASTRGPVLVGQPKAFVESLTLLDKWSDGTAPSEWGEDTVLVVDSLTTLSKSCFEWAKGMNPTSKDPRQWYFAAQSAIEDVIAMLFGDQFKTNVIVISHVNYTEDQTGIRKGHVSAIGSALGPKIPKYVNTLVLAESSGVGANTRRVIRVMPTGIVDVKTPAPFTLKSDLPIGTGLAEIFKVLKGG